MTGQEKVELIEKVLGDIRELKQRLVAADVGRLTGLEIIFLGESAPTRIKYGGDVPEAEWQTRFQATL